MVLCRLKLFIALLPTETWRDAGSWDVCRLYMVAPGTYAGSWVICRLIANWTLVPPTDQRACHSAGLLPALLCRVAALPGLPGTVAFPSRHIAGL